jgi:hypothetical protein
VLVQISIQVTGLDLPKACDTAGASAAITTARIASHETRGRWADWNRTSTL